MTKIGFIGTGNMAQAIIRGMIASKHTAPENIFCVDPLADKLSAFSRETGVAVCASKDELVSLTDVVVLAVKPNMIPAVLHDIREPVSKKKPLIVSIAAAVTLDAMSHHLYYSAPIIRVMPNVNATVGAGVAAVCPNEFATREQTVFVLDMFKSVGSSLELAEKDFSCFSALAGASPAFSYIFIDALSRGAVKNGLPKDVATKIAAQAVLGSAKMILESDDVPWALVDKVCSPGGTTIAGVSALEQGSFVACVMSAIDATVKRDKELMEP